MKNSLLLLLLAVGFNGCATVLKTGPQTISVKSIPSGAKVRVSHGETGFTPFVFSSSGEKGSTVIVSKPGYRPLVVEVKPDPAGGGWKLVPNPIVVELSPFKTSKPSFLLSRESFIEEEVGAPIPRRQAPAEIQPIPEKKSPPVGKKIDANGTEYL